MPPPDLSVVSFQRLADGTGLLAPNGRRAIKLPVGWTVVDHPLDTLAGDPGGPGQVTGYLELVPTAAPTFDSLTVTGSIEAQSVSVVGSGATSLSVDDGATIGGVVALGAYLDFTPIAAPGTPASGHIFMYLDVATGKITFKTSAPATHTAW